MRVFAHSMLKLEETQHASYKDNKDILHFIAATYINYISLVNKRTKFD